MIQLNKYQEQAVKELREKTFRLLGLNKKRQHLIFEAPTGAGKTLMVAEYLKQFCEELANNYEFKHREVSFIWISPNKLYQQSKQFAYFRTIF